jgi:hypothetical protein
MTNARSRLLTPIALVAGFLLTSCVGAVVQSSFLPQDRGAAIASLQPAAASVLYKQATAGVTTTSAAFTVIPGMALTLPAASSTFKHALLTFNAPSAQSNVQCEFNVVVAGGVVARQDLVTSGGQTTSNIVVLVPLKPSTQPANVQWATTSSSCMVSIFYSFSAILTT